MKTSVYFAFLLTAGCLTAAAQAPVLFDGTNPVVFSFQGAPSDDAIPASQLITPEQFARSLKAGNQTPLILQVGPHTLYTQAHIPGAEYIGASSSDEGRQKLRERVKTLPHKSAIILYCGCCPWSHCPNVHAAYKTLRSLGFTNVKVLYIADNFGSDWVSKGYPVAKGD
jgi:thiosulfate/3-mercaptopyruvate sulfurtransferase